MEKKLPPGMSAALLVAVAAASASAIDADPAKYGRPAEFTVTADVINKDVRPFTATIGSFGNALVNVPFEPAVYRTRFFAATDSADRVVADTSALTGYDSFREGFYDGADIRVYRVTDGKMKLVRTDTVPQGGSVLSGWNLSSGNDKLVAPRPGRATYSHVFDGWNRSGVPYWFTVAAVSKAGAESARAKAVSVVREPGKTTAKPEPNETVAFRAPKDAPDSAVAAPQNLVATYDPATGAAMLSWDAPADAAGIAGYRVYRSDYAPENHRGCFLQLADKNPSAEEHILKGDMIVVDKTFTSFSRNKHHSNRVWGSQENKAAMPAEMPLFPDEDPLVTWTLESHGAAAPVADGGATCAKFTMQDGAKLAFSKYNHGPTGQTWYRVFQPGETYVVEFWARQQGMANPSATFKLNGFYSKRVDPVTFGIGGEWKLHRAEFTINDLYEGNGAIGQTSLVFEGAGTLWLDNYRVYLKGTDFLDYFPHEYADLKASGMETLRTHGFIKTKTKTYSMEQLTNPGGAINGVSKGNTLPQTLAMMRKAGVLPWLQIEYHMSPDEWRGFVEYLAAPANSGKWAGKRAAQGQRKPWADEFTKIYFEIGNETWNWLFAPWVFESMTDSATGRKYDRAEVYGLFQEHVIDCLKSSPHWTPALDAKVEFVLGGWAVQNYGLKAAATSPRSHFVTRPGYNGGWDEGEGPSEGNDPSLFRAMSQAGQTALPEAAKLRETRDKMRAEGVADFLIGTYEAGPGYALSGLNNQAKMTPAQVRAQEETMKSLAVGTATLDTFLGRAANDFDIQNFFTYSHGRTHWVSHAEPRNGGAAHPCWMTLALFNNHGTGDMLRVDTAAVPAIDLPAHKRRKAAAAVPLAACYATRRGDRLNLFILSRKIDNFPIAGDPGFTPVTVRLPLASAKSVTLHRLAGDPRAHNLDQPLVSIETIPLPSSAAIPLFTLSAANGAHDLGLPPGATLLYVFEGVIQ